MEIAFVGLLQYSLRMHDLAAIAFRTEFARDLIQYQGAISFALLLFWFFSVRKKLLTKLLVDPQEKFWVGFSVLFAVVSIAVALSEWGSEYLLVAFALGGALSLALLDGEIAACFATALLFLRPWELLEKDDYLGILPRLSFTLCLAHIALGFVSRRKLAFSLSPALPWVIAFGIWAFLTIPVAPDPMYSQVKYYEGLFKAILLFLILIHSIRTIEGFRRLVMTLVICFLGVGLIAIFQTIQYESVLHEGSLRLQGFGAFIDSNDVAALMVMVLPFGVALALRKLAGGWVRAFGAVGSAVVLLTIFLSGSRGALVALAVMGGMQVMRKFQWGVSRVLVIAIAVAGALFLGSFSNRKVEDLEGSSTHRITYLKAGLSMGIRNPLLGVGFEGFPDSLSHYATGDLAESSRMTAHNSWVLAFAETGVIGFLFFVSIYFSCLRSAWGLRALAPELFYSMVGYGVAISFLSHSYLLYPYLLYALVSVAVQAYEGSEAALPAAPILGDQLA